MKFKTYCLIIASVFLLVRMDTVFAQTDSGLDTIYFKNNQQVIGQILSETDETVIVDVFGITSEFQKSQIESIVRDSGGQVPSDWPDSVTSATGMVTSSTPQISGFPDMGTPETPTPLEEPQEEINQPLLPVILPPGKIYQVEGIQLKLREGPEQRYTEVATLHKRTLLIELETMGDWIHVKTTKGEQGWVHSNFVSTVSPTPVMVTGNQVRVRVNPDTIYQTVTRVNKGDVALKVEEQFEWWRVITSDIQSGWTNNQYLQPLYEENIYKPQMSTVSNQEAGMPVLLQRVPEMDEKQTVTLTVRENALTLNGMIKLMILHSNEAFFQSDALQYSSENIIQRQRIGSSSEMVQLGLPEKLALQYTGADILTMLGKRVNQTWEYRITLPDKPGIGFAIVFQQGENRGQVVEIPLQSQGASFGQ